MVADRDGEEVVIIDVAAEITPALSQRIATALGDFPHELRRVPPNDGIVYQGDPALGG